MRKYIIKWDSGFGKNYEVEEFESQQQADRFAYDAWKEEAENNAVYGAELLTPENAEEYGFESELDDEHAQGE